MQGVVSGFSALSSMFRTGRQSLSSRINREVPGNVIPPDEETSSRKFPRADLECG